MMRNLNDRMPLVVHPGDLLEFMGWRTSFPFVPARRGDYYRITHVDTSQRRITCEFETSSGQEGGVTAVVPFGFFINCEWRLLTRLKAHFVEPAASE